MRDYLYVEDAASALYQAFLSSNSGLYNIGSGKGIKIKDVAKIITSKINSKTTITYHPEMKKTANIILNIKKATTDLQFTPRYFFPDKLDELINEIKK
jgi:nucleoside-diphosphate-sugar epimerase